MLIKGCSRAVRFSRVFADRCAFWSATGSQPGALSPVAALFLILLIVLIIPSWIVSLAYAKEVEHVCFHFVSSLAVWFLLYRLCSRTPHRVWFIAVSISTLYSAAFWAPWIGWLALCFLFLVHGYDQPPQEAISAYGPTSFAKTELDVKKHFGSFLTET